MAQGRLYLLENLMSLSRPYQLLPYGTDAWLLQLNDAQDFPLLLALQQQLVDSEMVEETVIGYDTLLLRTLQPVSAETLTAHISALGEPSNTSVIKPRHHDIPVRYNGPDLEEVAAATRLDTAEIIALHSAPLYTVRFLGFSPGFAYLDGLDPKLQLPRRATPRTRMEAGAVAIGGSHAGIYSIPSPGGWNWLGHTDHPLFCKEKTGADAFTLHPGYTVRFTQIPD